MNDEDMTFEQRAAAAEEQIWTKPKAASAPLALPSFPAHLLPPVLANMVQGVADQVQAPIDVAGMLALSIASSTLSGKVCYHGRPGHEEQAMLWTMSLSASAERKTPVFNLLRKPLTKVEQEHAARMREKRERDSIELDLIENEITKAKKSESGHGIDSVMAGLERHLKRKAELTADQLAPCGWVSSPTPEAVHSEMTKTGGRLAVFSDEGGVVGVLAGRYSSKGGADMDPFLHGYVGSALRAPRAGKERKDVAAAYLTIGLAVQPAVLAELGEVSGAEEKGLLGRFLFSMPNSRVGTRMYEDSIAIPADVVGEYEFRTQGWASWLGNEDGSLVDISMDDAARLAYAKFSNSIEMRLAEGEDLSEMQSWGGKIAGTALRIAGLMHCYAAQSRRIALETPIGENSILCAAELVEDYLIPHAKAVFAAMSESAVSRVARRAMSWMAKHAEETFTKREIFQALKSARGSVKHMEDLEPAINQLVEDGYVREAESPTRSVLFEINPLWDRRA